MNEEAKQDLARWVRITANAVYTLVLNVAKMTVVLGKLLFDTLYTWMVANSQKEGSNVRSSR